MKTLKIIVKGYVQRVGYREEVERIARELGVTGYAKNLEDKELSVEVIAQHKDDNVLKQFADKIRIKHYPLEVREIKSESIDTEEDYAIFTVVHGPLDKEFGGRMVEARRSLDRIENTLDKVNANLGTKIEHVGNKLDGFNQSTQEQFQHLDGKYHTVSEKLEKISNSLEKVADYLPRLLNKLEDKK